MAETVPAWRSFRRRISSLTVEELRPLYDWSLLGPRIYQLSQDKQFHIVAKVDVYTPEPLYPCRPSEVRWIQHKLSSQEFPDRDESKWTYPTGRFTTWLRTAEIKEALARGHLLKCHEALISIRGNEDRRRWERLRQQVFKRYGRRCMRCGRTSGEMHVDHIKPWRDFPELRYDQDNMQVLCCSCHEWKGQCWTFAP
jgi:5-methylcytosine-specific restriction endonuclease McrA